MSTQQSEDVKFEMVNNAWVITLNRPRVLNSLSTAMAASILTKLQEWQNKRSPVNAVIIKGAGDRAFCAGGDLKEATDRIKGPTLFRTEFKLVHTISNLKIPYIALIDGFTMGGGMGISVHGRYRVATERTVVAMPENKIGLFPDVGGSYFLSRMPLNLGIYLGLTGERLKGSDVVTCGIATHYVLHQHLGELERFLTRCTTDAELISALKKFSEPLEKFSLASQMKHINYCFSGSTFEDILLRLEEVNDDWSQKTFQTLEKMCPGSLKISLRAMRLGAELDLDQCLSMEYRIAHRATENHDFPEGVRALLLDKDNTPQWNPASLADVTEDYIDSYFRKLPQELELVFD